MLPSTNATVTELHSTMQINAFVIDVKDEQGNILLQNDALPAELSPASGRITSDEIRSVLKRIHENGMYAIARVVVFKDDVLARADPAVALRAHDGSIVHERDGVSWVDPENRAVWSYNLLVAVEAAREGFDEIQFDYVRFPSVQTPTQAWVGDANRRSNAIREFLAQARAALTPYNVFTSADVFGYTIWDLDDTNIGQRLTDIAPEVDYICPMLYPSFFRTGLPGARIPVEHPDQIVSRSLRRAQERTRLPAVRFRPWLQAFQDSNFDYRPFRQREIVAQTQAAERFGSNGWMLWNRHGIYSAEVP